MQLFFFVRWEYKARKLLIKKKKSMQVEQGLQELACG
jgi:hypothetical protein